MKNNSKEYLEGLEAANQGKIPPDNPYQKNTKEYNDWLNGLIDGSLQNIMEFVARNIGCYAIAWVFVSFYKVFDSGFESRQTPK